MQGGQLNEDFQDLLLALQDAAADFVVVGAHALAVHGVTRATGDLDIFIRPGAENAARVFKALADFGAPVSAHGVTPADLARPGTVYQMGLPPRRIDLLNDISGRTFDEVWKRRVEVQLAGLTLPVIGRADLLENKRAAGRPKDLLDVELLQEQPREP